MMLKNYVIILSILMLFGLFSCKQKAKEPTQEENVTEATTDMKEKLAKYVSVKLTADVSELKPNEREMLHFLFEAAKVMDELYWKQTFGNKEEFLASIKDEDARKFAMINYGPWDRLDGNNPFLEGFGPKPKGANYYPADMTEDEYESLEDPLKDGLYTVLFRDEAGELVVRPYSQYYAEELHRASDMVRHAAELAEDPELHHYLMQRAEALLTNDYQQSDFAWLDMKNNTIDFVIGPIEQYDDKYERKTSFESFILIKDKEWSKRLEKYTSFLPQLQKMLPVEDAYKAETPGSDGNQLNAYDVIYYAGDCNAGSKTIAINLPNDPIVRKEKGSRKLQLKNAMQAKFDNILVPISEVLIEESQRKHITFDAFFTNTMFHEVAHGLGLSYTIKDEVDIRTALGESYTSIEEGKADILGLYCVTKLHEMGELGEVDLMDYYVTFMTSIFRSVRFGTASSHGKANMMRFYYFQEKEAFVRDSETGLYSIDFEKMKVAMEELAKEILVIQGDGDGVKAAKWIKENGSVKKELQADLDRLSEANIPVDVVFEQGFEMLGL